MKFKIVFTDAGYEKVLYGGVTFLDDLVKVQTDRGNTVYINKKNIVFIKELGGNYDTHR